MTDHRKAGRALGFCDIHGKMLFTDRKNARMAIRHLAGRKDMREYACDAVTGMFHIGHMPPDVRSGVITAGEIYGRPA